MVLLGHPVKVCMGITCSSVTSRLHQPGPARLTLTQVHQATCPPLPNNRMDPNSGLRSNFCAEKCKISCEAMNGWSWNSRSGEISCKISCWPLHPTREHLIQRRKESKCVQMSGDWWWVGLMSVDSVRMTTHGNTAPLLQWFSDSRQSNNDTRVKSEIINKSNDLSWSDSDIIIRTGSRSQIHDEKISLNCFKTVSGILWIHLLDVHHFYVDRGQYLILAPDEIFKSNISLSTDDAWDCIKLFVFHGWCWADDWCGINMIRYGNICRQFVLICDGARLMSYTMLIQCWDCFICWWDLLVVDSCWGGKDQVWADDQVC